MRAFSPRLRLFAVALGVTLTPALGIPSTAYAQKRPGPSGKSPEKAPAKPPEKPPEKADKPPEKPPEKAPEPAEDPKEKARALFKKGAEAVEAKRYAEGVELLEQAEALFHAPTHVLYIARAQAGAGKLVEAKATYEKLRDENLGPKPSDPFKDAQKKGAAELDALLPRIPKVVVHVEPKQPPDLSVAMNAAPLAVDRLGKTFELNPGSYTFEAKGGGLVAGKVIVDAAERTTIEVRLVLQGAGETKSQSSSTVVSSTQSGWPAMKVASIPFIAIGAAGLAAGGVFGALHFVRSSEADDNYATCGVACKTETENLDQEAATFGNVAIGALAGGAALFTTGIILFALAPGSPSDDRKAASQLMIIPLPGGFSAQGRF